MPGAERRDKGGVDGSKPSPPKPFPIESRNRPAPNRMAWKTAHPAPAGNDRPRTGYTIVFKQIRPFERANSEGAPMDGTPKPSIINMTLPELRDWLENRRLPAFRSKQIFQWIYRRRALSFQEMDNLPLDLRSKLNDSFALELPAVETKLLSETDHTEKRLFRMAGGEGVETVRMPRYASSVKTDPKTGAVTSESGDQPAEYTLCLSSQAGCLFACRFCASGQRGLDRNLDAGEIVSQVLAFVHEGVRVARIVFMGTGEPLHNWNELKRALEILCDPEGLDFSSRKITISTVGLAPEIYRLGMEDWKTKLAVSLHAPTDEKRAKLIPMARCYRIDQLMDALTFYQRRNSRRITFEYLMIGGFNDSQKDADRLAALCKPLNCHVNLIPFNPVERAPFEPSSPARVEQFRNGLRRRSVDATIRFSRGRAIDAACGQLRLRQMPSKTTV